MVIKDKRGERYIQFFSLEAGGRSIAKEERRRNEGLTY